jgi:flagellar biogenesis protein FliO
MSIQQNWNIFTIASQVLMLLLLSVFNILYFVVVLAKTMRKAGHVAHMTEQRRVYKVLVGKPMGKRPLGRLRHRCKDGN